MLNSYEELLADSPAAVAEVMMTRVLTALEDCPDSDEITESYVFMGDLAWDECCGVVAASWIRTFKSAQFPQPVVDVTDCDSSMLAVDLVIIVLRCAPSVEVTGVLPTPQEINDSSIKIGADAALVLDAVMAELPKGWERANVEQTISGADGGCVAIDTRLTVGLPQTDWCSCSGG